MTMTLRISFPTTCMVTLTMMLLSCSEAFTNINHARPISPSVWKRDYPNYHQFQSLYERDIASSSRSLHRSNINTRRSTFLMYEPSSNDPRKEANDALKSGFWNALEFTEQWITETLRKATEEGKTNPYARKELNYFCEMNEYTIAAVASIFRRFKEAREMGERHSYAEEHVARIDPLHEKSTLRQTQVIIVPFCQFFDSFQAFESVIQAINEARRNAQDLVTDSSLEKMAHMEKEWNVSINGASLHPRYGERTPKEIIEDMEQFNRDGKVDMKAIENSRRRNYARRSPYPTLVIEVQVAPPTPMEEQGTIYHPSLISDDEDLEKRGVLKDIVMKLESIFAKSAALHKKTEMQEPKTEDSFYSAIGEISGVEEIVIPSSPIATTQQWVVDNDPLYNKNISSFTSADVTHADSAFEFVFSNLAMHRYSPTDGGKRKNYGISSRSYLIMPKFVSSSATSLETFVSDVKNIISKIDGLEDRVSLSFMHPEHVRDEKRSPVPVVVLQWYDDNGN